MPHLSHAERFAASKFEGVTVDQVRGVIREFLAHLAVCPVCNGTGEITFARSVELRVEELPGVGRARERYVEAGSVATCPACVGDDEPGAARYDAEHVAWHCTKGDGERECEKAQTDEKGRAEHADCGYRIMLPTESPAAHTTD
jgi:hypothetical protein